jgi:hypothetical protein
MQVRHAGALCKIGSVAAPHPRMPAVK